MKKILYALSATLMLVACSKEIDIKPVNISYQTIEAVLESPTKTSLVYNDGRYKVEWTSGDSFAAYCEGKLYQYNQVVGSMFATTEDVMDAPMYGYYPSTNVQDANDEGFLVNLPPVQIYTSDNIAPDTYPMVGKFVNGALRFKNLGSILCFKLSTTDLQEGVELEAVILTADQPLSGTTLIRFSDPLNPEILKPEYSVTLLTRGVTLSKDKTTFFLAIPSGEYTNLNVQFVTTTGSLEYKFEGPYTFTRSNFYSMDLESRNFILDYSVLEEMLAEQIQNNNSPYVSYVYDVDYAPGQFINTLPAGLESKQSAIESTATSLVGKTTGMVHLGGWGGSVTVGFDHPILNLNGADFRSYGNAFFGSSEPGVHYVAQKNANGEPDKWYMIKHAMYDDAIHDYEITYHIPGYGAKFIGVYWKGTYSTTKKVAKPMWSNMVEVSSPDLDCEVWYNLNGDYYKLVSATATIRTLQKADIEKIEGDDKDFPETKDGMVLVEVAYPQPTADKYIFWTDNKGHEGWEIQNSFHKQSYWPTYAGETIVITGEYIPTNSFQNASGTFQQDAKWWGFPTDDSGWGMGAYGYCDNYPNNHDLSCIDIDWAVDENGNYVHLDYIDFVRVQSATHKQSGSIGEISTEFCGISDLHILGENIYPDITIKRDASVELVYWPYEIQ